MWWSVDRASDSGSAHSGFDSESDQIDELKIGIHSFPAWRSALKRDSVEKTVKFACGAVGKKTLRDFLIFVP